MTSPNGTITRFVHLRSDEIPDEELLRHLDYMRSQNLSDDEIRQREATAVRVYRTRMGTIGKRTNEAARNALGVMRINETSEDFWSARPYLKHIHQAAHSRQRSADAVLGVVLARVASLIDHRLRIPAIVGGRSSLTVFSVITGASGVGKSTANEVAAELLPGDADFVDRPIGSGEGMAEAFYGEVEDETAGKDGKPKTTKVRKQVRHNAFFYVDEGQIISQIGRNRTSTLMPTMRSAFAGSTLGNQNADTTRHRIVRNYTMGVVIGIQDKLAADLMNDTDGGTSQRFLWFSANDRTIPAIDDQPTWPGPLMWSMPDLPPAESHGWLIQDELYGPRDMTIDQAVTREIKQADLDRIHGTKPVLAIDAHAMLIRLKVAALFAVLDGRTNVTGEDWALARLLQQRSNHVRADIIDTLETERRRAAYERDEAQAISAVNIEDAKDRSIHNRTGKKIAEILISAGGSATTGDIHRRLSVPQRAYEGRSIAEMVGRGMVMQDGNVITWIAGDLK